MGSQDTGRSSSFYAHVTALTASWFVRRTLLRMKSPAPGHLCMARDSASSVRISSHRSSLINDFSQKACWKYRQGLEALVWLAQCAAVISLLCRVHSARRRSMAMPAVLDLLFGDTGSQRGNDRETPSYVPSSASAHMQIAASRRIPSDR